MNALLFEHPFLTILTACVLGFLGEWLLELFFFRRRLFETEATLRRRDRELSDLKFELSQAANRLKNREVELEATQKARQSLDLQLALARQEIDRAKADIKIAQKNLDEAAAERELSRERLAVEAEALLRTRRAVSCLESENAGLRSQVSAARAELAVAEAAAATESDASFAARSSAEAHRAQAEAAILRIEALERRLAASSSVHAAWEKAVKARDLRIAELVHQLDSQSEELQGVRDLAKESERTGSALRAELLEARQASFQLERDLEAAASRVAGLEDQAGVLTAESSLAKAETGAIRDEVLRLAAELEISKQAMEQTAADARSAVDGLRERDAELDSLRAARKQAESLLRSREMEVSVLEKKAAELELAFNEAAEENGKIGKELSRLGAQAAASDAARRQIESERIALEHRVAELESQIKSAASARAALDDSAVRHADILKKLQAETAGLASSLSEATDARAALEAEVQAVSASHSRLESELAAAREETETLRRSAAPVPAAASSDATVLLNDLEAVSRERNELAAELAVLKAAAAKQHRPRNASSAAEETEQYAD